MFGVQGLEQSQALDTALYKNDHLPLNKEYIRAVRPECDIAVVPL